MSTESTVEPLSPEQILSALSAGQTPDEYRAAQASDTDSLGDDQPAPDSVTEPDPTPARDPDPAPYIPPQVDEAAERLAAIAAERAALLERIDSGELTFGEYEEARAPLDAEQRNIEIAKAIADHDANVRQHQTAQSWASAQQRFWSEPGNEKFGTSQLLFAAMNAAIGVVANEPGADTSDFDAMLAAAKARVVSEFGSPAPQAQAPAASKRPTASAAPPPPVYSLTDIPGGTAPASDPFAAISAKTGMDQIQALANLPEDQLERWMNRRL